MANSRDKGKRGELEAVAVLDALGLDCRRSVQYCGRSGDADITCDRFEAHIEVKRTERLNPYGFIDQAIRDSKGRRPPLVMMRSSNRPWLVMLRAVDLPIVAERFLGARRIPTSDQQPEAL